ncbi:MAG: hypothetical protein ABIH00_11320 [Armatimonadota bacterium]
MKKNIPLILISILFLVILKPAYSHEIVKSGEIIYFKNNKILFDTGDIVDVEENAPIIVNGSYVPAFEMKPSLMGYARINPSNLKAQSIDIYDNTVKGPTKLHNLYISKIEANGKLPLRNGEKLTVFIKGTPKKYASFSIMGIKRDIPMKEIYPGTYKGVFKVISGTDTRNGVVVGKLKDKNNEVSAIYPDICFAPGKPEIISVSPESGGRVFLSEPYIYATYKSPGTYIDASRCAMYLNGVEVPAQRSTNLIIYKAENLRYGENNVKIIITDMAGNVSYKKWRFFVK